MDELNQWENFAKEFTSDFEYVHIRNEMNSNRYEISFRLKISLRCSVSSLLVFTWIEAKWNSKRYGFHIGHFDRNEISFRVIKYRVNTTRNEIPTYPSEYRVILKCSRNETSCEQNLFSRRFEISNRYEFISFQNTAHIQNDSLLICLFVNCFL